jgi:hypothetical protein
MNTEKTSSENESRPSCLAGVSGELPLSEWLQTTMKGRHLMMQITFPIANQFKTHPEKIPIELVVEIVKAVRGNFC